MMRNACIVTFIAIEMDKGKIRRSLTRNGRLTHFCHVASLSRPRTIGSSGVDLKPSCKVAEMFL